MIAPMEQPTAGGADADPLLGQVLDERYRIERPLGEGGIGRVYEARHLTLGRMVALKVLLTQYESIPVLKQRFEREARALAALSHPNIVTVTDFGVADGNPYIVMELLEGRDLSQVLAGEPLAPERALDIVRQTLRALAYAHEQGLVHRDLKPHNVFVRALGDGTDHVEVLDFGLARFLGDAAKSSPKLTKAGALIGTPAYMAPEQASGEEVDARADIYAVGCVLFEALTGRRVFESKDPGEMLRAHLLTAPPALSQADPGLEVSPRLEALVQRALSKSPAQRFASAKEMIAELDAIGPDAAVRVGPRPPRDQPVSVVAPTQAAGEPVATRAATPSARRDAPAAPASVGASIHLPKSRGPLLGVLGCGALLAAGAVAAAVWALSGEPEAPVVEQTPVPEAIPEAPDVPETPPPPPRPPARDPFAEPLPEPLAAIHARVERGRGERIQQRQLRAISRYQREHVEDPRPHLLLAHIYTDKRWLGHALPEYRRAWEMDPTVRGDPAMLPDLLEIARSERYEREAGDFVVEVWGAEALPAIETALEARLRREEVERLERLRERLRQSSP
jgi:serine/threonine-protein kinase